MMTLEAWLMERRDNCLRIAKTKTDQAEIDGWLEDAAYFHQAVIAVRLTGHGALVGGGGTRPEGSNPQ